jgi:hypothetical protein
MVIRQKLWVLQELVEGAGQNLPREEQAFILSVVEYFLLDKLDKTGLFERTGMPYISRYSWIKSLLQMFLYHRTLAAKSIALTDDLQLKDMDSIKALRKECQETITVLQFSWEASVKLFNGLRLKYTQNSA